MGAIDLEGTCPFESLRQHVDDEDRPRFLSEERRVQVESDPVSRLLLSVRQPPCLPPRSLFTGVPVSHPLCPVPSIPTPDGESRLGGL